MAKAKVAAKKVQKKSSVDPVRIVVLQRGWVVVGRFSRNKSECSLRNGHVVRTWGTTKGLGEIAMGGPTANTVLDSIPVSYFHELTVVFYMECDEQKWADQCPAV